MKRLILLSQCLLVTTILIGLSGCARSPAHTQWVSHDPFAPRSDSLSATQQPKKIALLLPLSGAYAPYATAIKNGFFTAYYDQKKETGYSPEINVINTSGKNINEAIQSAVSQQADFIVGPLEKSDVFTLTTQQTPIPVLALNTTPTNTPLKNAHLYQFGLSPTNEAQVVAQKAWQDHRRNVIILASNTAQGHRVAEAFAAQWQTLGGSIVTQEFYGSMPTLSKSIMSALQIQDADKNARDLKNMLRENIRFIPDCRRDFDSIFLVATPAMGRQIQPLLHFYFADNIPIYAISQIYSGTPAPEHDHDLEGITFCDLPWVIAPSQLPPADMHAQQQIQALWPDNATKFAKFYAMGVDAYHLLSHLGNMPSQGMPGATGTLSVTPQHHINRQLPFAKFVNGSPQLLR